MNLIEVARAMTTGEYAKSPSDAAKVVKRSGGLYWSINDEEKLVELTHFAIVDDNWEIEIPFVDFWTAWQAARDEGWAILWESGTTPLVYNSSLKYMTPEMINGRWRIINQ